MTLSAQTPAAHMGAALRHYRRFGRTVGRDLRVPPMDKERRIVEDADPYKNRHILNTFYIRFQHFSNKLAILLFIRKENRRKDDGKLKNL